MSRELVDRWLTVIKPFSLDDLKGQYLDAFSKRADIPNSMKDKIKDAVDRVDLKKLNDAIKTFAEEHFSEDALGAAVALFESEVGKKYIEQRDTVMKYFQSVFGLAMADAMNEAFGSQGG